MRALLTWPLRRLAYALIPGWLDDGSPNGWRERLIVWCWGEDDRRSTPPTVPNIPPHRPNRAHHDHG